MFMNSILDSIRMIPLYWCFPVVDHSFQFFLGGDLEKDMFDVTQNPNSKRLRSIGGEALRWKRESHGLRPRILPWNTQKKTSKNWALEALKTCIWVNYNISLTWIKAIWDDFPY